LLTLYAYLGAARRLMRANLVSLARVRLFLHQKARETAIKFQIALLRKSAAKNICVNLACLNFAHEQACDLSI